MKSGFEVFEFGEEDELTERADAKFLSKFKNPNPPDNSTCQFAKCVARTSDGPSEKVDRLAFVDVDATEHDQQVGNHITAASQMVEKDLAAKERKPCQDAASLSSLIISHDFHSEIDCCQTANSSIEQEERITFLKSESKSIVPVADDNFAESDPSRVSPAIARDCAFLNGVPSTNCFDSLQTAEAEICIPVDYVVYQKNFLPGCSVFFSHDNIKISGLTTPEQDQEIHSLEKGIDDIVHIQCEQLQRFEGVSVKLHVLSKDAGQVHGTSGVEELEFVVSDPDWSGRWQQITSLNVKYMSLWRAVHDNEDGRVDPLPRKPHFPNFERVFEDVIYPEGDCDAVSISKRDVDLLEPETFINDTIIDFYIQYLKNQIPSEEKHKFHFFNSFFFRKLADLDKDPSSALDGRAAFLRVHKWTRKVDLFGKDYVFIPVNFGLHWSLLVICHPGEVASFKEEDPEKSLRLPCILHMDSIKGTHAGLKNLVQSYLWEEFKQRQKEASEDLFSKFMNLRFVPLELPQQENSFDCGLFLLHYLELFLSEAPVEFNLFNINKFSKFLSGDWFHPAEASLKRSLIQKLVAELLENRDKGGISSGDVAGKAQSDFPDGGKESGVEFVARKFTPTEGSQGIEMTMLETSSPMTMRNSECIVGEPNLVLRDLFHPGVSAGSLHAKCSSFEPSSSYYHLNGDVAPMEADPDGEFMEFPSSEEAVFSNSFSFQGLTAGASSWKPKFSMREDAEDSSSETSSSDCESDDSTSESDIGITENFALTTNGYDACKEENINTQTSSACLLDDDNNECLTDSHASMSPDIMLETCATEGVDCTTTNMACDSKKNHGDNRSISMTTQLQPEHNATSRELLDQKEEAICEGVTSALNGNDACLESASNRNLPEIDIPEMKPVEEEPGMVDERAPKGNVESASNGDLPETEVAQFEAEEPGIVDEKAAEGDSASHLKRNVTDIEGAEADSGLAQENPSKRLRLLEDEPVDGAPQEGTFLEGVA